MKNKNSLYLPNMLMQNLKRVICNCVKSFDKDHITDTVISSKTSYKSTIIQWKYGYKIVHLGQKNYSTM